jgi:hypothetical protein
MAKTNLKLVSVDGKVDRTRPVVCDYKYKSKEKVTHSRTPEQAIQAAVKRVLAGEWLSGAIYDKNHKLVAVVRRVRGNIFIEGKVFK